MGFGVVLILIIVGLIARLALPRQVSRTMQDGLSPTIYYVTNPVLMVVLLAETDLRQVIGIYVPIALVSALVAAAVYFLLSRFVLRRRLIDALPASMASAYANAGNIGLPIALFSVSSAVPAISVLVTQLLVIAPLFLTLFALATSHAQRRDGEERASTPKLILKSVANPVTIAAVIGAAISLTGFEVPAVLWEPLDMLGHASVPLLLMVFGMSLVGQTPFRTREILPDVLIGLVVKLALLPVIAWLLGAYVFGLGGTELFGVVIMAALPTAQNVFLFSTQFGLPTLAVRDITFASALLALPSILVIGLVLAP
jgi:predicted permease